MFHAEVLQVYHQCHLVNEMTKLKAKVKEPLVENTTQRHIAARHNRHITGSDDTKAHYWR